MDSCFKFWSVGEMKSIKRTPTNNEHITRENMWKGDCKSNITWCCQDFKIDINECSSLSLESSLSLHHFNCKVASVSLHLCCVFYIVLFSCSLNSDFSPSSHSVELHHNQPLFSVTICFKVNHSACSAVNNVSLVCCHGNDPLNKS